MQETVLRDFFKGRRTVRELCDDLLGAVTRGRDTRRVVIVDMDSDFEVHTSHLVLLCDAVLDGELQPAELETIGFCLVASDRFDWDSGTEDGGRVANTVLDWSSPGINFPLTHDNIRRFRARLLGEEDAFDDVRAS